MEETEQPLFTGRRYSLEGFTRIRDQVLQALSETTVLVVLREFKNICSENKIYSISGSIYWIHAIFLFLHWLLFYPPFEAYKKEYKIASTTANNTISFILGKVNQI